MTARLDIVHKLFDRKGGVSGYMVKNGHGAPDEYRVYDAEGNFLYGIVVRQPWTVFRIFGHDGRLIYVGCIRTKNLRKQLGRMKRWKGKHTKAYQRALERGKRPPKWIKPFDWIEAILLVEEEYPNRQQAEDAEKRYVGQMFPKSKYRLSTPGRRKFGPHKGTRKYIVNPQAPRKREGKEFVQRTPSQKYLRKAKAFDGTYKPWEVSPGKYVNVAGLGKGWEYINAARLDEKGRPTRLLFDMSPYIIACRWQPLAERLEKDPGGEKHYRSLSERLKRHQTRMVLRDLSQRIVHGEGLSLAGPVDPTPLTRKSLAHLTIPRDSRNRTAPRQKQRTVVKRPRFIRLDIREPNEEELRLFDDRPWRVPSAGKVRGFQWGRMDRADLISLKKPDTVHLPKKLAKNPELLAKDLSAVEEAWELDGDKSKKATPPTLVSSVLRKVETYQLGRWSVLKRDKARTISPNEGKYEGLNEILAELDGEEVNHTDRRIREDTRFRWKWNSVWAARATDATDEALPALPWAEAYRYIGEMLERDKLTKEDRVAVALQLSILLKRFRHRGTLEWTAIDALPQDQVPKADVVNQKLAAELCGVGERTLRDFEAFERNPKAYTPTTLRKIHGGLCKIEEEAAEGTYEPPAEMAATPTEKMGYLKALRTMYPEPRPLTPLTEHQEWIVAVRRGQEVIALNLDTLYRERFNFAGKEVVVKRGGILMGLARRRFGNWDDLAQAAFLGLWKDAGHKQPDDTDKRHKHAPVEYSLFVRAEDGTLELVGDEDPAFAQWAWKRGDSPATAARTKDRAHRKHQIPVGEGWRLDLLRAHQKITADHNAAYMGTKSPVWTARHVILLELARGRSARQSCGKHHIPIALRCGAAAKVLRVVAAHLYLTDPRRQLKTRVIDWPRGRQATPERTARIGETHNLYPIRRSVADWKRLGPMPAFASSFDGTVVWDVSKPIPTWKRLKAAPSPMRLLLDNGVQPPLGLENEVWPGDPLKDLEKLYKMKRLKEERRGPERAAELDPIPGVEPVSLGEAAEDVWDPQGMGVGVDTYDPEDDRGDLSREKVEE